MEGQAGEDIIREVCGKLGAGAYGQGRVSLLPGSRRDELEFEDGGSLVRLEAVLRASGYESEEALSGALEEAAQRAAGLESPVVRVHLPAVISLRREDGFKALEAGCEIIFEGGV